LDGFVVFGLLDQAGAHVDDVMASLKLDLSKVTVHPTLGMEDPWNYRNKAQVPVGEREGVSLTAWTASSFLDCWIRQALMSMMSWLLC
jgi:tRNA/tmRNA/rRNA uracil-C5-methylase (TrmA/RlmC/RlmD family)